MSTNPFRNRALVGLFASDDEAWSNTDESIGSVGPTGDQPPTDNLEEAWWNKEESVNSVTATNDQVPAGNPEEVWSDTDDSVNVVASTSAQGPSSDRVPGPNDIFIAVMGLTGAGKSSFIQTCSGKSVTIGHGLESCTTEIQQYCYEMSPERAVWLIDTPGFDDTNILNTNGLKTVAEYLTESYKENVLLHGIIYLHRITDIRMTGAAQTHKKTVRELCGEGALKRVILATTMWDEYTELIKYQQAEVREEELKQRKEFWGHMLQKGSSYHRYKNTRDSARDIVNSLAKHDKPIVTALQKEIVDDHRTLIETSAGHIVHGEIIKIQESYEKRIEKMEKDMRTADDERRNELQEERERYAQMIEDAKSSTQALDVEMGVRAATGQINEMRKEMQIQGFHLLNRIREMRVQAEENLELERSKHKEWRKQRKMRDESRDRELQKVRDKLAQQTAKQCVIIHRTRISAKRSIDLPYSITMVKNRYFASSGLQIRKGTTQPHEKSGSSWLSWVTFGTNSGKGGPPWMAQYENGDWSMSEGFEASYPNLEKHLSTHGLSTLWFCVLGPNQSFYAQWDDAWQAGGPKGLMGKFESLKGSGQQLISISFGYGNSFLLSYGRRDALESLNTYWNLDGHYPALEEFLKERRPLNVIQIALDQKSTTDFAIVTAKNNEYSLKLVSSRKEVKEGIWAWWTGSKPS